MADTGPAKLPGIPSYRTDDRALAATLNAIIEHLEVRSGARGNPAEKAVVRRDLDSIRAVAATPAAEVNITDLVAQVIKHPSFAAALPTSASSELREVKSSLASLRSSVASVQNPAYQYITAAQDVNGTIASAETLALDSITASVISVTGTTTVTAITLAEGKTKTLRFEGALVLTNGASLTLPGGANITTAAGEFATFRGFSGGVVRCTSYTFASATSFPAGTAALPSITPRGDPDTGFYFPAANTIGMVVGGTERVRINSSGHLGLRATQRLCLDGAAGTGNTYFLESSADTVDLYVGGTLALRVTAAGQQSPVLVSPNLGTPSALVGTNITGTAAGLTAGDSDKLDGNHATAFALAAHTHSYAASGHVHQVVVGGTTYTTGAPF